MIAGSVLAMTQRQHRKLHDHLFPGDGLEAAAILLCNRAPGPRTKLLVKDVHLVPHEACTREQDWLTWPGLAIEAAIDAADAGKMSIILLHSHPGGYFDFSRQDDSSDHITMPGIFSAIEAIHGSAIMTPNGAVLARTYRDGALPSPVDVVNVVGDDIRWWWSDGSFQSLPIGFSSAAREMLGRLSACVIGASGTGSIVAEQAARLGFGKVQIIDFDRVEDRNLNRILNSTRDDAQKERLKVNVLADAIERHRGPGIAQPVPNSMATRDSVLRASQADVLFVCVDSLDARFIADQMGAAFLLPMFDVGVVIPTRLEYGLPAVADVVGRIDYVRPDGVSLGARGVYSPESLRAEYLRRADPQAHAAEMREGYLKGAQEQAPSVIALNMRAASACVLEFLARAFPFRHDPNGGYARTLFSVAAGEEDHFSEVQLSADAGVRPFAAGEQEPLLGIAAFAPHGRRRGSS